MKQNLHKGSSILIVFILSVASCKKSVDSPVSNNTVITPHDSTQVNSSPVIPYPVSPLLECNYSPYYGDSIVFTQPSSPNDYYVYPQNDQGVQGTYLSWPAGLTMNPNTGAIDLTSSQTGQRYSVAFVKAGTTDTCVAPLIVGGVAYMDSVYVLALSDTTSVPYFNANPALPSPCASNQGPGCQFDYNDYAKNQGIAVDQHTGYIDLQKTMKQSLFGLLPINGTTVYTTIYYKLNDNSNFAPQSIQLQMVYYNHKSDVPANLLTSITNNILNTLTNILLSKGPSPRPPLIIIVRNN